MKFQDLETGEEVEVGYVFAFAPLHPVNQEDYAEAQRKWLQNWQPWPGDLPQ